MPVRFRRTFTIFPGVKVNVSKGGVSFTVGTKGYHLNFSNRGVKQTVGLPGTGVSHSTYLFDEDEDDEKAGEKKKSGPKRKRASKKDKDTDITPESNEEVAVAQFTPRRRTPGWVLLLGIIVVYLGALVLGLIPTNFLSQLLGSILNWTRSIGL